MCAAVEEDADSSASPPPPAQGAAPPPPDGEGEGAGDGRVLKLKKRGIIYLSSIPPLITVAKIREIFSQYGEVGRVYLQINKKDEDSRKKKKNRVNFTEGWVEFESKRIAKRVSEMLNNERIGTRKKSKYYDSVWNIKYLPRFKWVHLSERLAYERAVYKQRLRTEIAQAKREAAYFRGGVEKTHRRKKKDATKT